MKNKLKTQLTTELHGVAHGFVGKLIKKIDCISIGEKKTDLYH